MQGYRHAPYRAPDNRSPYITQYHLVSLGITTCRHLIFDLRADKTARDMSSIFNRFLFFQQTSSFNGFFSSIAYCFFNRAPFFKRALLSKDCCFTRAVPIDKTPVVIRSISITGYRPVTWCTSFNRNFSFHSNGWFAGRYFPPLSSYGWPASIPFISRH